MSAYALPDLFDTPSPFSFAQYDCGEDREETTSSTFDRASTEEEEEEEKETYNALGIAIKEAKIDSALLIQSLCQVQSSGEKINTTNSNNHNSVSNKIPRKRRRGVGMRTSSINDKNYSQTSKATSSSPTTRDALKFELSISFNGRKYTAVRSLPSLEELRQDLMEEVNEYIPELRLDQSMVLLQQGGYSFSFLQNVLQSCIPTVERWLYQVTQRISPARSPSLRSFLWEPVSMPHFLHRGDSHSSISSHLDRIEETEVDDEDEDGEEQETKE